MLDSDYTVTLTVTDKGNGGTVSRTITADNVPPTVGSPAGR